MKLIYIFLFETLRFSVLQIIKKYKAAFYFVLRFFVVYILFSLLYNFYLNSYENVPDGATVSVAKQTVKLINLFNYDASSKIVLNEDHVRFYINGDYVARIVEGCNGISVYILFLAFIIAFKGKLKHTVLFVLGGGLLLYIVNIARVGILTAWLYKFPERADFMHQIIFPVLIYGMVFLLWVLWVNKFATRK